MTEIWKPIESTVGAWEVSNEGRIRNGATGNIRRTHQSHGYENLRYRGGVIPVHRAVAIAFIPNPEGHPLVRHLDDVKTNNHVSNLAWGTYSDNAYDAIRNGRVVLQKFCKRGHEFTEENTILDPRGRRCRACQRLANNASYRRRVTDTRYEQGGDR